MGLFRNRFIETFISAVAKAMVATGHGYKRDSLRNTGKGTDRRMDKMDDARPNWQRNYESRYSSPDMKLSRRARRMPT